MAFQRDRSDGVVCSQLLLQVTGGLLDICCCAAMDFTKLACDCKKISCEVVVVFVHSYFNMIRKFILLC